MDSNFQAEAVKLKKKVNFPGAVFCLSGATVKTLPSLVISAVRLGVRLVEFEHAKIAVR